MLWLFIGPTGVYLLDFCCSGSSVLFTNESLIFADLYVLGDNTLIS